MGYCKSIKNFKVLFDFADIYHIRRLWRLDMEIIFHGQQNWEKIQESLNGIIKMLHDKYKINQLREIHLSVTLVDEQGFDVELVDSETHEVFRIMEVYRNNEEYLRVKPGHPLSLVVDNTKNKPI
jgi:hypothetical protein